MQLQSLSTGGFAGWNALERILGLEVVEGESSWVDRSMRERPSSRTGSENASQTSSGPVGTEGAVDESETETKLNIPAVAAAMGLGATTGEWRSISHDSGAPSEGRDGPAVEVELEAVVAAAETPDDPNRCPSGFGVRLALVAAMVEIGAEYPSISSRGYSSTLVVANPGTQHGKDPASGSSPMTAP